MSVQTYEFTGIYNYPDGINYNYDGNVANGVPEGTTFTLDGLPNSMFVIDDDNLLEDNNGTNAVDGGQSKDATFQILESDFISNSAGDYVWSRAFQNINDSQGNPGQIYQIRIGTPKDTYDPNDPNQIVDYYMENVHTYYAISGEVIVSPDETYTVTGGFIPTANQTYEEFAPVVVPCFTRGMKITTDQGEKAVEELKIGDRVLTYDNGFQEIRFISSRKVKADGDNRPILFEAGVIGNIEPVIVSPNHRFLGELLPQELLLDSMKKYSDHLINAIWLVNGETIRFVNDMEQVE